MKALGGIGFPVPVMRALCLDESVVGTSFYVMDYLQGRIFRDARLPDQTPADDLIIDHVIGRIEAELRWHDEVLDRIGKLVADQAAAGRAADAAGEEAADDRS